jgi:hypothetical protein
MKAEDEGGRKSKKLNALLFIHPSSFRLHPCFSKAQPKSVGGRG